MTAPRPPARLSVIFAREAPVAAVLRTGPARHSRLIRWDTATDTFTDGQWVKHKIYPERAALSPDGRHLVYFAYLFHLRDGRPGGGFTVVSQVPYFTALGMYVEGSTWGGGGVFLDDRHVVFRGIADLRPGDTPLRRPLREVFFARPFRPEAPDRFVDAAGKPVTISRPALRRLRQHYGLGPRDPPVPRPGLPPLPDWCAVRDGCLYRRDRTGHEMLLRDFNAMEFEPLDAPYT